jgi:hypothetical protein
VSDVLTRVRPGPSFVEPRRECGQVIAFDPSGDYRRCGAHVLRTIHPDVVYCPACGRHTNYWHTKVA